MLVLLIGAKGGVGTTSVALHLARAARGVALDLADGRLAACLERKTWSLVDLAFVRDSRRQQAVDQAVHDPVCLLHDPEMGLSSDKPWQFVRDVAARTMVVADGGIAAPAPVIPLANRIYVVTAAGNPVAEFHTRRLQRELPGARAVALDLSGRGVTRVAAQDVLSDIRSHPAHPLRRAAS